LAGRDSFQKRQKEAARREKRQVKLERRQGRQQPSGSGSNSDTDENGIAYPVDLSQLPLTTAPGRPSADPLANLPLPANPPEPAPERRPNVLKPAPVGLEPPKSDTPRREP
jgi:hypothetical protein